MRVDHSGYHGDLKSLTLTCDGKEITTFMSSISIYQDIFTPCWSANITIEDSANIIMNIPIRPGSEIELTVETSTDSQFDGQKSYQFIIYQIRRKDF